MNSMEVDAVINPALDNDGEPISKRIRLAKNAFISKILPLQTKDQAIDNKEEGCLKWLSVFFEKEEEWIALQQCLCRDPVKSYNYLYISPGTRAAIVTKLSEYLIRDDLERDKKFSLIECSLRLFDVPIFKQHFNLAFSDYVSLIGSMIRSMLSLEKGHRLCYCQAISHNLKTYCYKFHLNDKFRSCFNSNLLCPLSNLLQHEDISKECSLDFQKCISFNLFQKRKHKEETDSIDLLFYSLIRRNELNTKVDLLMFQTLHNALSYLTSEEFISLLSVVFASYIRSSRRDSKRHCQVFLIICYLLGLKPSVSDNRPSFSSDVESFFSMIAMEFPTKKIPYRSLAVMVEVLNKVNIDTNVEVAEFSLVTWLQSLCECICMKQLDEYGIAVLTAVSDLDPMILEPYSLKVIGPTMLKRDFKSKKKMKRIQSSYVSFLRSLLYSSVKLHRLQKLASRLLTSAKEELTLDSLLASKITAVDVFPQEFCLEFGKSMQSLFFTQALAMLKTLMYHLLEDCVQPMEQGKCDPSVTLMLQLTKHLLCEFLLGYKAIDPNIPDSKIEKFFSVMEELGNTLGRLGKALLLDKHNPDTMGAFLEMSLCWGDLQLLLIFYRPDKPSKDPPFLTEFEQLESSAESARFRSNSGGNSVTAATDFSSLHRHLSEGEWSHLVERIVNFGDDTCKEMLNELVMQKLKTLQLFESEMKSDKARACAHHLLSKSGTSTNALSLIAQNDAIVIPLLDIREILKLSEIITSLAISGNEEAFVAFRGNAVVVPVTTLSILKGMGENAFPHDDNFQIILKRKSKEDRKEENNMGCNGAITVPLERDSLREGMSVAYKVFSLVTETLSLAVPESRNGGLDDQALKQNNESAAELLMNMSTMLEDFLQTQLSCEILTKEVCGKSSSVLNFSMVEQHLKALSMLPLPHLSENLRVVVLMSLIGLLAALREHDRREERNKLEIEITKVVLVAVKGHTVFVELVNYLNVGKFLSWYITEDDNLTLNENNSETSKELGHLQETVLERFVEVGMSNPVGIKQLKVIVTAIKKKIKESGGEVRDLVLSLSSILMISIVKKIAVARSKSGAKKLCLKYYRYLAVSIIKRVNFDESSMNKQKLECFIPVLRKIIMIKSPKKLLKVTTYLNGLVNMVKERFGSKKSAFVEISCTNNCKDSHNQSITFDSCCLNFIVTLLRFRKHMKGSISKIFAWEMWQLLISVTDLSIISHKSFSKAIKYILGCSNQKEFLLITEDLQDKLTVLDPLSLDPGLISRYMVFWKSLVQCSLNRGLVGFKQSTIKEATPVFLSITRNWQMLAKQQSHAAVASVAVPILEFEHELLRREEGNLHHEVLDLIFESIAAFPLGKLFPLILPASGNSNDVEHILNSYRRGFIGCSTMLSLLVVHHSDHVINRIPTFLQCLGKLFGSVTANGNVEHNAAGGLQGGRLSEHLLVMTDCASSLEWVTNSLISYKKDFVRSAPYFIADAINCLTSNPVHPAVKNYLHNCIYGFIYLCDTHGIAYLHHSLNPGPKEVFKSIYENYKRYYKFKGKI